ncbi:MAG TPA: BlaI/MecI/CopY family transcriptional regulator [Candidatus Blautia intestinipullorum]|nr:BlaI/MecI/CopY family transcriptional regulator [Candidatus Blautia intestinipullorum]
MKRLPQISEAEYEVMKTVWRYAPITTNEVTDRMLKTTDWSPKTVQTLLKRLVTKGALTYEKKGRMFVYSPVFPEEAYLRQKNTSFLRRYYNGNLPAMFSSFLESEEISEKEIDSLRSILNERFQKEEKEK